MVPPVNLNVVVMHDVRCSLRTSASPAGCAPLKQACSRLEDLPWHALFGQRVQELRREEAVHQIDELACIAVDLLCAQVPDHTYFHPACWRKNVRVGDEPQVMRFGNLLDIMLHHWISAEDFDVDGHTPTVRRRG